MNEPGYKNIAICNKCESIVSTTYQLRDVAVKDTVIVFIGMRVSVCDVCDSICALTPQATAMIHESLALVKGER